MSIWCRLLPPDDRRTWVDGESRGMRLLGTYWVFAITYSAATLAVLCSIAILVNRHFM